MDNERPRNTAMSSHVCFTIFIACTLQNMNSATLFVYEIGRATTLYVCVRNRADNLHEHLQNSTELPDALYTTNYELLLVQNIPEINSKHI